jgi:hypothetical protein
VAALAIVPFLPFSWLLTYLLLCYRKRFNTAHCVFQLSKIGNNQLIILIRNAQDQNVNDAQIEASAVMPAMGSMPEMREALEIKASGKGFYQGSFRLPMNGPFLPFSWLLTYLLLCYRKRFNTAHCVFQLSKAPVGICQGLCGL